MSPEQQPKIEQAVEARAPLLVFLGGYLVPREACRVEPSAIEPHKCRAVIVRDHPALPAALREQLAAIPPNPIAEIPAVVESIRVFGTLLGERGAVFVECAVIGVAFVRMPAEGEGEDRDPPDGEGAAS